MTLSSSSTDYLRGAGIKTVVLREGYFVPEDVFGGRFYTGNVTGICLRINGSDTNSQRLGSIADAVASLRISQKGDISDTDEAVKNLQKHLKKCLGIEKKISSSFYLEKIYGTTIRK